MADGGQRLLDVIDDPRALESFLGSLTSDDLLHSSNVNNVVEQLTNSLEAEYGIDSPNDTLFDTLDSSANLTDLSQSNVPFDFGGDHHGLDSYTINSMELTSSRTITAASISNNSTDQFDLNSCSTTNEQQQLHHLQIQQQQYNVTTSNICDLPSTSSSFNLLSSSSNIKTLSNTNTISSTNSSTFSSNSSSSAPTIPYTSISTESFISQQHHQQQSDQINQLVQQQQVQISSLSSNTIVQPSSLSTPISSNTISMSNVNSSSNTPLSISQNQQQLSINGVINNFQQQIGSEAGNNIVSQAQQQFDVKTSMPSLSGNLQSTVPTSSGMQVQFSTADSLNNTTIQQSQTITAAQFANLTQFVQQAQHQAVLGPQIITNAAGGLQLQQHSQQPSFIIDSNGQIVATGGSTGTTSFSTANLALLATAGGGQPTYAVLAQPSAQQLFSTNTITMQPQTTIQSIKNPNGSTTYFQTSTPQIIGTNQLQQAGTQSVMGSVANNTQNAIIRPKAPPQLLPKPSGTSTKTTSTTSSSNSTTLTGNSNSANTSSNSTVTNVSSNLNSSSNSNNVVNTIVTSNNVIGSTNTTGSIGTIVTSMAAPTTTNSLTIDSLGQFLQQHGQQTVTSSGLTFSQPSFAIGPNGSTVMVNNLNTMTTTPQAIVMNQFGQQMIVPAAVGQGGIQFILRQQPTQPQMLTIQSPSGIGAQNTAAGKPIVRYISQMPQVNQNQGTVQLQQIQTPSGPQWITVRTTPAQIQTQQIQTSMPVVTQVAEPRKPAPTQQQHPQVRHATPISVEPSPEPPKKKAKQSKKKVTIDLNDLFKKAGIDSMDFEDDGFDFLGQEESSFETSNSSPIANGVQEPNAVYSSNKMNGTMNNNNTSSFHSLPHVSVLKPVDKTKQKASPKAKGKTQPIPVPVITLPKGKGVQRKQTEFSEFPEPPVIDLGEPFYSTSSKTPPKPKPPPKGKGKKSSINFEPVVPQIPSPPPPVKKKKYYPKKKKEPAAPVTNHLATSAPNINFGAPPTVIHSNSSETASPGPISINSPVTPTMNTSIPNTLGNSVPRIHTISLTLQNQQLLRNIQIQINRLVSLLTRNETEETALQKLRVLQQQVIATGITVPNPPQVQTLGGAHGTGIGITPISYSLSSPTSGFTRTTTSAKIPSSMITPTNSSNVESQMQHISINNSNLKATNILLSQPPPLILNNKVIKTSSSSQITNNNTTTSLLHASTNNNSGQLIQSDNNNSSLKSIVAVTTDSTTKRAIIISVTNNNGTVTSNSSNINNSVDSSSTTTLLDKVTSNTAKTTTTTTISTSNGGFHQYPQQQQYQQPQQPPILIRTTFIDDKKSEELRLAKLKLDEETRNSWRKEQFENRLKEDQDGYVHPDCSTPFSSLKDMATRLSRFHVAREKNEVTFEDFDADFGEMSGQYIDKFHGMVAKYRALLLRESIREVPCCEHVMLERIFVGEERASLEQDRNYVSQGEILDLPPPPPSWVPQIEEYVETELKEMERDSIVNQQVQSAIDSIITFGNNDTAYTLPDDSDKIEVDAFGVPISSSGYNNGMNSSSSADIDEAVRSILV